jgi:hypothetical protein
MDIERLSKSQIVLLTLLVSFVTSIATGIVTVSLMDQAPPVIAQTVNRIVERTVEKVVPMGQAASVVTTEKTVVVKESDLIAKAVETMRPSLVHIYASSSEPLFLGLGIVLDAGGTVVSDGAAIGETKNITLVFSNGTRLSASVVSRNTESGFITLQSATTTSDGKSAQFNPATLAVGKPSLGQTVIVLSGKTIARIEDGIVTALMPLGKDTEATVDTNVSGDFIMSGSPLINTDGSLMGVSTMVSRASSPRAFMPSAILVQAPDPENPADEE